MAERRRTGAGSFGPYAARRRAASAALSPCSRRDISPSTARVRRELLLERGDRVGEHPLVRRCSRRKEIGFRARERELDRPALRLCITFHGRQRAAGRLPALNLRLLELDVLALEASRHH